MSETSTYNERGVHLYEALLEPLLKSFRAAVTRVCREQGCSHVLDVGCGPAMQGARLAEAGIACTGMDNAPAMLAVARRLAQQKPNLEIIEGEALHLPFATRSLDTVLVSLMLHQMSEEARRAALSEALRVGRRVMLVDYRQPERNLDYGGFWLARGVERLAGGVHYRYYRQFMQKGGLEGLVFGCPARVLYREPVLMGAASIVVLLPHEDAHVADLTA